MAKIKRQIALDTETTGMNMFGVHYRGHRIIEIGCTEIIDRRLTGNDFHVYLNPNRTIDSKVFKIHGISNKFLQDKPNFSDIAEEFLKYIKDSELIIHNSFFDLGFLNYEMSLINKNTRIEDICYVIDSLSVARKLFPGKHNNLNALCTRYSIDNTKRTIHGALMDSKLLAKVFLAMTGGQISLFSLVKKNNIKTNNKSNSDQSRLYLKVIYALKNEIDIHEKYLDTIKRSSGKCLWRE